MQMSPTLPTSWNNKNEWYAFSTSCVNLELLFCLVFYEFVQIYFVRKTNQQNTFNANVFISRKLLTEMISAVKED